MKPASKSLVRLYISGFVMCLVLTLGAFAVTNYFSTSTSISTVAGVLLVAVFALVQLIVQLMYFLHLGNETKPRINTLSFTFMAIVVLTVGFGSLWIMNNLDYHMMPSDIEEYIKDEEQIDSTGSGKHN